MASTYEIIEYNNNFPVRLFFQRIGHVSSHWHDSIEILFVLSGELTVYVESETSHLKEGDIILINYNQFHETYSDDCTLLSLQFRLSMFHLDWLAPHKVAFFCDSSKYSDDSVYLPLKQYLALLIDNHLSHSDSNNLQDYSYCYSLMNELVSHFSTSADTCKYRSPQNMQKIGEIISYIEQHYQEKLTIASVARHSYLSPSYFSHFFESITGSTFYSYLSNYRLERSLESLMNTTRNLSDIAEDFGFANARSYTSFFKRKYGVLPTEFRKTHTPKRDGYSLHKISASYLELEKNDCIAQISHYLPQNTDILRPTIGPAMNKTSLSLCISREGILLRHTFRNFCSIGRAADILYAKNCELLEKTQQDIGFRYIKFHAIFDDALFVYRESSSGTPQHNFYYTDQILHQLIKLGLKPLIELSFMPATLASNPAIVCNMPAFNISEPKDDLLWCNLVEDFTRHCLNVFGHDEVESWIFTFWNETLTNQVFNFSSDEVFFRLYQNTRTAVKTVDPQIPFASTSFTSTIFPTRRYQDYLTFMEREKCLPDAFLFHFYATSPDFDQMLETYGKDNYLQYDTDLPLTLSKNPDLMSAYFSSIESTLRPGYTQPFYLTEWSFSPSHREYLNDTVFSSCYLVKNILENYDRMESFCHWSLTDQIDELPEAEKTFHGGLGMFTRNGLPKPIYHAYCLLKKLEDVCLESGTGYFVTANHDRSRFSIILYHYHHFSDMYAEGLPANPGDDNRYAEFSRFEQRSFNISLQEMKGECYMIQETYLNRHSGSVYDKWLELGGVEPMTEEDVQLLAALSTPVTQKRTAHVEENTLTLKTVLEPLEVRLIRLSLQS